MKTQGDYHHNPATTKLRTLQWADSSLQQDTDQEDQDYFSPQGRQQSKDMRKEFQRIHSKMMSNKNKRQQSHNIAVPQNRDALLLKYGPMPQGQGKGQGAGKRLISQEEMPSYKKDAMRLIINRIYRYIGNVFDDMQKKVIHNDENNQRAINIQNQKPEYQQQPMSDFRQMFEMKKQRIKNTLEEFDNHISETQSLQDSSKLILTQGNYDSKAFYEASLYETPPKDEILQIDNYSYDSKSNELEAQLTDTLERIHIIQFQDPNEGALDSQRKQNNRYLNDEDREEEKMSIPHSFIEQQQDSRIEKAYSTRRHLAMIDEPILEQRIETSPHNMEEEQIYHQEQSELIILPPIKKEIKSYLGNANSKKPHDMVDMSFNENPFNERLNNGNQTSSSQGTNQYIKEFNSNGGQNSPDFKRHNFSSVQSSQMHRVSMYNTKVQEPIIEELILEEKKPKFQDKLKDLIGKFQETTPLDQASKTQDDILANLQNQTLNQPSQSSKTSKLSELRRKLNTKAQQNSEFQVPQNAQIVLINESIYNTQEKSFTDSPLGKMYKLADNEVLFEESKRDVVIAPQVFQIKSKKPQAASKGFALALDEPKRKGSDQVYQNYAGILVTTLKNLIRKRQKEAIMELMRHQLDYQKVRFLERIKEKLVIRKYFLKFRDNARKQRGLEIVKKNIENKIKIEQQLQRNVLRKWQQQVLVEQKQIKDVIKQKKNANLSSLVSLLVQKERVISKKSFDQIVNHSRMIKQMKLQSHRNKSLSIIEQVLKRKQLHYMNKRFQKFRKMTFLQAFDSKMMKLASILESQVKHSKKDSYKAIVNYCIRNDPYKRQCETLSSQFQEQKAKIIQLQLQRFVKIANNHFLMSGFSYIRDYSNQSKHREQLLANATRLLIKFHQTCDKSDTQLYFKKWLRNDQKIKNIANLKTQSCKKIKLLLSVAFQKSLKSKFYLWKNETTTYITNELTRYNQEKTLLRNSMLEQILVDMWWRSLNQGFTLIKRKSQIKKSISMLMKKKDAKELKRQRIEVFGRWKTSVYKYKLLRVNLTAIMRAREKRVEKILKVKFLQWKKQTQMRKRAIDNLGQIMQSIEQSYDQKLKHLQSSIFYKWAKLQKNFTRAKHALIALMRKQDEKCVIAYFLKWKLRIERLSELESKQQVIAATYNRIIKKIKFNQFKVNAKCLTSKIKALKKLDQIFKLKYCKLMKLSIDQIKLRSKYAAKKLLNQKDALKIIKRLSKNIDARISLKQFNIWKLKHLELKQDQQKKDMKHQYQQKIMSNIIKKTHLQSLNSGFQHLKQNTISVKHNQLQNQVKFKNCEIMIDKIQNIFNNQARQVIIQLFQYSNNIEQNIKINQAISKLSAATKISQYLERARPDRPCFLRWKRNSLKVQAFNFGFSILDFIHKKHLKEELHYLNSQTQARVIQETKTRMGLTLLYTILQKRSRQILSETFNSLKSNHKPSTQLRKTQPALPPRTQLTILENSNKKKKVELLFMMPPTPQQRMFPSVHHSKSNSANNSILSQKNLRYSQKSDEEDDQIYDYDLVNRDTNKDISEHQSLKQIKIKPKLSLGPMTNSSKGRESLFSNRSTSNGRRNRYDESPKDCEEFTIASENQKNQELKASLTEFILEEQKLQKEMKSQQVKKPKKRQQQLNKYLSNISQGQFQTQSSKRSSSASIQLSKDSKAPVTSAKEAIEPDGDKLVNEQKELKELLKSQSLSKLVMSPNAKLESVPEVEENIMKQTLEPKNQKQSKLSHFLTAKQEKSITSKPTKDQQKQMKKKSQENNQKFSFFLTKQKPDEKYMPKCTGLISPPSNPMSYSTSNERLQNVQSHHSLIADLGRAMHIKEGAQKLQNITVKRALVRIIEYGFTEESEQRYSIVFDKKKQQKLTKVIQIGRNLQVKPQYMKQEAFLRWKRLDYLIMLESLKSFKNTVSQIYQVSV